MLEGKQWVSLVDSNRQSHFMNNKPLIIVSIVCESMGNGNGVLKCDSLYHLP